MKTINYKGPLGDNKVIIVKEWLKRNVGVDGKDWQWSGYTIILSKEDATAFKLKFGL
jgi:hypothetical protein